MIKGTSISKLINDGYLIQDEHYSSKSDLTNLVWDEYRMEYTEESINLTFGSEKAIAHTVNTFKENCLGFKTIFFNPNTLINQKIYDALLLEGVNVKMYDSVNSDEKRSELMEWFRSERDAVLLNVQVFTTGLDVTDIECVFLNKKTQSINLYIQMVGRGGRPADNIFKPKFKVIDMGQNLDMFGKWSEERDWEPYFYRSEIKPMGTPKPAITRTCHKCNALNAANSLYCSVCGVEKKFSGEITGEIDVIGKKIIPSPDEIIKYCERNKLSRSDAKKIIIQHVSDAYKGLTRKRYFEKRFYSFDFRSRAKKFMTPYYFAIQKADLEGTKNRTLDKFVENLIEKIDKHYEYTGI